MGDFVIRSVRIHDNGDNVFNPEQDTIFNLDGNLVQETSSDVQVLLNELGVHSLSDIRGRSLPDLSRYQHFIAMGGRHLERNEFQDAASNLLSAAELGTQMHLPAGEMFQGVVELFEQRQIQNTYGQIQRIIQSHRYTFASLFLGIQLLHQMPEHSTHLPQNLWNTVKQEFFGFFYRELMSMLHGEIAMLENNPHGLPQVDRLWDVCRQLEEISRANFSEAEANNFVTQIEGERRRLLPLGFTAAVRQSEEMLRDPWTHSDNLHWIQQRLEFYRSSGEAHAQRRDQGWWLGDYPLSCVDGLISQIQQRVERIEVSQPSNYTRVTNMDEAGSALTGTVWFLRQIHKDPSVPISIPSLNFTINDDVRATAAYQVQIFREMRNLHLRIGTQNTLHIFLEGTPYRENRNMEHRAVEMAMRFVNRRIQKAFPHGMPQGNLNEEQARLIYALDAAYLYQRLYPNVEVHGIDAVPPYYHDVTSMPGVATDYRESNAAYPIIQVLRNRPGQEVALQLGAGHRVWDEFERLYRASLYPMPQIRSVCWGNTELEALGPEAACPAFSE